MLSPFSLPLSATVDPQATPPTNDATLYSGYRHVNPLRLVLDMLILHCFSDAPLFTGIIPNYP
jgi:hypothetical protein